MIVRSNVPEHDSRLNMILSQIFVDESTYKVVAWQRSNSKELIFSNSIERYFLNCEFGEGKKNLFKQFRWNLFILQKMILHKPRIIYACDLDTILFAILLKKILKLVVIYDEFDSFEFRLGKRKLFRNLFRRLSTWAMRRSDCIIVPSNSRILPEFRSKTIVVVNFSEPINHFSRIDDTPLAVYVGTIGPDRMLEAMIAAFVELSNWNLVVAGENAPNILKITDDVNIQIKNSVSQEQALEMHSRSWIMPAFYDPSIPNNRRTSSNKLHQATSLGIPLVTNAGTDLAEIIEAHNLGWVIEYGSKEELIKVLRERQSWTGTELDAFKLQSSLFHDQSRKIFKLGVLELRNKINSYL